MSWQGTITDYLEYWLSTNYLLLINSYARAFFLSKHIIKYLTRTYAFYQYC